VVLDLGGTGIRKRGHFDIERYGLSVFYSNISMAKSPSVQADAACHPFKDATFDVAICSELLEHVSDPWAVLRDVHRLLRPGGIVLICVPFLYRIHGDPHDYGRYTDHYWRESLSRIGFQRIEIEKQGLFWCVLMDMVRDCAYQLAKEHRPRSRWLRVQIGRLIAIGKRMSLTWDARQRHEEHPFFSSFTTGFGIRAVKGL
jgi:SAM-dependent methyltransferase